MGQLSMVAAAGCGRMGWGKRAAIQWVSVLLGHYFNHSVRVDRFSLPSVHFAAVLLCRPPVRDMGIIRVPTAFDSGSSFQTEYR